MAGTFLSTCAVINIVKIFKQKKASRRETMDPHQPQMEDGERKENFIDRDFQKHESGESIQSSQDFINNDTPILNPTYDPALLDEEDEEQHGYQEEKVDQI